jgi:hypothetical protein
MCALSLDDPGTLPRFLERTPDCVRSHASYPQKDIHEILDAVDAFLHRAATQPR